MELNVKEEIKWLGIPFAVIVIFFGVLTGFKFGIYPFQFNGAQLDIHTFEPLLLTYCWITLIALVIREWNHQYHRKVPLIILLIINSLAFVTTILFMYSLLIASTVGGIIELIMDKGQSDSPLLGLLNYIKWGSLILIPFNIFLEFYLISKLKKVSFKES